jgi:hypothetical protein
MFVLYIVSIMCLDVLSAKCCGVRYDFRIPAIFVLSLPLVVCWRAHVIFKSLSLYILTMWKCITYNRFCRDTGRRQTKHKNTKITWVNKGNNKITELWAKGKSKQPRCSRRVWSPNMVLLWQLFYLFCSCI